MDTLVDLLAQLARDIEAVIEDTQTHRGRWLAAARLHVLEARFAVEKSRGEDGDLGRFRASFSNDTDWQAAMERADELEAQGMRNRAWRVRRNLDETWPAPGN